MNEFRTYLQQEFVRRTAKNPAYSLRAYASHLKINHATLSSLLSGKRKLSSATTLKLAKQLNFSPSQLADLITPRSGQKTSGPPETKYTLLQQDTFSAMSEWYFDAILEMVLIPRFKIEAIVIAKALGISKIKASLALETLKRLGLIVVGKGGRYELAHPNSENCLDDDFTSVANRRYQKSLLEKSIESLETVDRGLRDHTSTTIALDTKDLPQIKKIIKKFRRELDQYAHREGAALNEVYQLQVSLFPLTKTLNK